MSKLADDKAVVMLNNIFLDINKIEANDLVDEYTKQYNDLTGFQYAKYNRAKIAKDNISICKTMLRKLKDEGYMTMNKDLICEPTQKLYNENDLPIGFKTKKVN